MPALLKETASADAAVRAGAFKALGRLAEARGLGAIVGAFTPLQGDAGPEAEGAWVEIERHSLGFAGLNKKVDGAGAPG